MSTPSPGPSYFGLRYILWLAWCNAITLLAVAQAALASVMLVSDDGADPLFTHAQFRYIILANAILTAVVAQTKKSNPPPPSPRSTSSETLK